MAFSFEELNELDGKGVKASIHIVGGCAASSYCEKLNAMLKDDYAGNQ